MPSKPVQYAILGALISLIDSIFFSLLGVEMRVGQLNVMPWLTAFFCINFAIFGFMFGKLKQTQQQLEERAKQLAESKAAELNAMSQSMENERLAALGRLSASVAHEVRNPLGVMRSSAFMISEDTEHMPQTHTAAIFIRDEVDRLNAFVSALLDYTRATSANMAHCTTDTLAQRVDELILDSKIQTSWPTPPHHLYTDPEYLVRIVHNLLLNALHFVDPETGRVDVRGHQADDGFTIDIKDNGPGVDPSHEAQLFEPFFTTRAQGTGLGLATCQKLCAAIHATLRFHPTNTPGAHFSIHLPRKTDHVADHTGDR